MGLQRFPLSEQTGGVNFVDGPTGLDTNEAQTAKNVIISARSLIAQRAGTTKLNGSGFPEGKRAENAKAWYSGSTRRLMLSIDGDVFSMPTGGELTERFGGTAGTVWCFEDMEKTAGTPQVWMMNGKDAPKKWNGVTFTDWAGEPPNGTIIRVWKNMMIVTGVPGYPQRVFYSNIGDPEEPAEETVNGGWGNRWIDIRTSADDVAPNTWLEVVGDSLHVHKKTGIFRIFDSTFSSFQRISEVGCEDRFQSAVIFGRCYFFTREGVYSIAETGKLRYESRNLEPIFKSTHEEWPINLGLLSKVRVEATSDRKVMVAIPTGEAEENDLILEGLIDLISDKTDGRMPWIPHTLNASCLAIFRQSDTDELVGGDSAKDQLLRFFVGTNDDGVAIEADYFPAWKGFITEEPFERLRRFNVQIDGTLTVEFYRDLDDGTVKYAQRLEVEADQPEEWDDGEPWDDGLPWDPQRGMQLKRIRPEVRGRYHAPRFRNSELDKSFTISATEFAFRGGKEH